MRYRKFAKNHRAYAVYRAGVAIDRLIEATTPEAKRHAARWAKAWFKAAAANSHLIPPLAPCGNQAGPTAERGFVAPASLSPEDLRFGQR